MNKKTIGIIAIVAAVIIAITTIVVVNSNRKNEPVTINPVAITVTVDGVTKENAGSLKDDAVVIDGTIFGKSGELSLDEVEALGYEVFYKSLDTEITVSIETKSIVGKDENNITETPAPTQDIEGSVETPVVPEKPEVSDKPSNTTEPENPVVSENPVQTTKPTTPPAVSVSPNPSPAVSEKPIETTKPVQPSPTPSQPPVVTPPPTPTPSSNVPESDLIDNTVGTVTVDAGNSNNLQSDGNGGFGLSMDSLSDGTIISRDDLVYTAGASTNDNLSNFTTILADINPNLSWTGKSISYGGSNLTYITAVNGVWNLRISGWGASMYCRNMFVTSMAYFGNKGMASAVYGMLDEHYRFRSDTSVPITKELASKYGLTINSETLADGGRVSNSVTNGSSTWTVVYRLNSSNSKEAVVMIDVK